MYRSPIELTFDSIAEKINKEQDDRIIYEIEQQVDIKVNKEELMLALAYDRHQYDAGFRDGEACAYQQIRKEYEQIKENLMRIEELLYV